MAKNILVINADLRETRVALIENGIIVEMHIERHSSRGCLGNIYFGKISRVLPGMQAAFIDIGLERAAFLHVEDLIRPDDFESYLAGNRKSPQEEPSSGPSSSDESTELSEMPDSIPPEVHAAENILVDEAVISPDPPTSVGTVESIEAVREENVDFDSDAIDQSWVDEENGEESSSNSTEIDEAEAESEEPPVESIRVMPDDAEPTEITPEPIRSASEEIPIIPPEVATGTAPLTTVDDSGLSAQRKNTRHYGRRGRVRRSGNTRDRLPRFEMAPVEKTNEQPRARPQAKQKQPQRRDRRPNPPPARDSRNEPSRISNTTPIREVIREGQEVIVQVSKEPIGTKGARVTSHISLPGRYVVYLPTVDHVGVSKRIGADAERARLREAIEGIKPPQGGLIVRTLAEGLTKKQLKADVGYLVRLWGEVIKKRESGISSPACIYTELDLVLKTARDLFTEDIEKVVIDNKEEYVRLKRFVEMFMPERANAIEYYDGAEPIFDAYGIEDEIHRALARKVPLASGGHLIIDQAEALTAIDVNTGRFVGKGSKNLEETILRTNLEAVEEIAYQLRFRNIGGLIILDLIDMERASNREKVRKKLEELLARDKAKTTLNRISDLGLIEMTRKRTRESLGRTVLEPCFYCDGTGQLQSKQTVAYEIIRDIRRKRMNLPGYSVLVYAHPAIVDFLETEEHDALAEAERMFTRRIELVPRKEFHFEQFDVLQGR